MEKLLSAAERNRAARYTAIKEQYVTLLTNGTARTVALYHVAKQNGISINTVYKAISYER